MPAILDAEGRDVRVGDYLDDKLQTLTDLDSLDALLSSVRNQHVLLKKQVPIAPTNWIRCTSLLSGYSFKTPNRTSVRPKRLLRSIPPPSNSRARGLRRSKGI